jgi:hypothetical protein
VVEPIRRVGYRILFGFLWDSKVGEKFDLEVRSVKEKINEVFLGLKSGVSFSLGKTNQPSLNMAYKLFWQL